MTGVEDAKRPQFGGRVLGEGEDVFKHNAWDNVEWGEEQELEAEQAVAVNAAVRVAPDMAEEYEERADEFWDKFYSIHQNRFFKDRNWIFTEFPDLAPNYRGAPTRVFSQPGDQPQSTENPPGSAENLPNSTENPLDSTESGTGGENTSAPSDDTRTVLTESDSESSGTLDLCVVKSVREGESWFGENANFRVLEIGCGTGSTVYPILQINTDPRLVVFCCDLSLTAVNLVKEHKDYSQERCASFVCDVTRDWSVPAPFPSGTLDIVTLIFVLSAIHPDKMPGVAKSIFNYLKPGGKILFRDYGRHDMAQLRFKSGKCLQDNFYVRGDGTRCYFFTQEEISRIFLEQGFLQEQNIVDRRLQVNRGKKLKMYRVWIQAKFVKPAAP